MTTLLQNPSFQSVYLGVPVLLYLLFWKKCKLDNWICAYLIFTILTLLYSLFFKGYNLPYYSVFTTLEALLIGLMVYSLTKAKWTIALASIPNFTLLITYFLTEFSSKDIIPFTDQFPYRSPIGAHQFFDISSLNSLIISILCFFWLYNIISIEKTKYLTNKSLVYVFAILVFHAGSFFTLAFARYLISDLEVWRTLWAFIFIPIFMLSFTSLSVGLLWKQK